MKTTRNIKGRVAQITRRPHPQCDTLFTYTIFVKPFGHQYSTSFTLFSRRTDGVKKLDGKILKFSHRNRVIENSTLEVE